MAQRDRGLPLDRGGQHLRRDVRIAVAVAADPRAHAQEHWHAIRRIELRSHAQRVLQIHVQPGQLAQERVLIEREAVVDLVDDAQAREAQRGRLPERQHQPVELAVETLKRLARPHGGLARLEQRCDRRLALEDALALDLGRMRREHRAHARVLQEFTQLAPVQAGSVDAREGMHGTALLRWIPREAVGPAAAILVHVLGDVREQREIAERAHDGERLRDAEAVEQRVQFGEDGGGLLRGGAMKAHRCLPDRLHAVESGGAGLLAQHTAQRAAEEPRVFPQRQVLLLQLGFRYRIGTPQVRGVRHAITCSATCPDREDSARRPGRATPARAHRP